MKDLKNNVDVVASINPAVHKTNQSGTGVDIRDFDSAMAVVQSGADTDGGHLMKIQDSDDDSAYADVVAGELEGSFVADMGADSVQRVGYKGNKRYIRVASVSTGSTGMIYGASIVRGHPHVAPTT